MRKYYHRTQQKPAEKRFRVNEFIRALEVKLIDENGGFIGIMPPEEALKKAREAELDLVEIGPKAEPPIVKIMDYGKFKYQKEKIAQKQKAKIKQVETKGLRLSLRIGEHDKDVRKNQALKFLEQGDKVRIEMVLKGREKSHYSLASQIINQFISELGRDKIKIEQPLSSMNGRLSIIIFKNTNVINASAQQ